MSLARATSIQRAARGIGIAALFSRTLSLQPRAPHGSMAAGNRKAQQAPPQRPKKKQPEDNLAPVPPLRGRAARVAFLVDLAAAAQISIETVRRFLDALRIVAARSLKETSSSRIPGLVHLRVRILPARDGYTKVIKGKACVWKARQYDTKKISGAALKQLCVAVA